MGLAVGVVLGVLALIGIALFILFYMRSDSGSTDAVNAYETELECVTVVESGEFTTLDGIFDDDSAHPGFGAGTVEDESNDMFVFGAEEEDGLTFAH